MKKEKSTFSRITRIVVWAMLIVTLGSIIIGAIFEIMPMN
ncbi:DUF4044 domain-containing protein [Agrilactobacillus fermenti]|nr:DUF4044 domain-containing protein [Agrilactobacillus fermenti]MCD2255320.1 DUF4044 domain-containing protein [Agrilactobacillus fermenti]